MFGRTPALVFVKRKHKNDPQLETETEPMDLEDISDQIVSTATRLATVAVVTTLAISTIKVAAYAAKTFIR